MICFFLQTKISRKDSWRFSIWSTGTARGMFIMLWYDWLVIFTSFLDIFVAIIFLLIFIFLTTTHLHFTAVWHPVSCRGVNSTASCLKWIFHDRVSRPLDFPKPCYYEQTFTSLHRFQSFDSKYFCEYIPRDDHVTCKNKQHKVPLFKWELTWSYQWS